MYNNTYTYTVTKYHSRHYKQRCQLYNTLHSGRKQLSAAATESTTALALVASVCADSAVPRVTFDDVVEARPIFDLVRLRFLVLRRQIRIAMHNKNVD